MSIFSNPASGARDARESYVSALVKLVADRPPLDVLRATPDRLRKAVHGKTAERLTRPEAPGKWAAIEVVQHLADSDLVWAWRLRLVVAEDRPRLTGYDQDAWASRLGYRDANRESALAQFDLLRGLNLSLVESLSPEQLDRVGIHSERGEESVAQMLVLYAGHDIVHLMQLERILSTP